MARPPRRPNQDVWGRLLMQLSRLLLAILELCGRGAFFLIVLK